ISGTAGQQAQAAMLQLTQGLSSGALRGEELNSVLENIVIYNSQSGNEVISEISSGTVVFIAT
ncbi:tape measure protein, partial [Pseudoflavonifractor phocaeensis]|uniref:tape measure protein n=1 Tax=Pseudoflavonifractor phocaeensis TaxID=1870988 RepID=UPI00195B816D|nr:tape measure protein [Pseudoflavonifractor phocaeensis]